MAKDKRQMERNRQKKLAREKARKKTRQAAARAAGTNRLASAGCTRAEIERAPVHSAYSGDSIFEQGIGHAVVARQLADGMLAIGVFLVDAYCLGVKDAFITVRTPSEYQEMVTDGLSGSKLRPVSAAYVKKLVKDAIAYARDLGFEPHRDYRDASAVLAGVDADECAEAFTFGKDGKPLYIGGPRESQARMRAIVDRLMARCGEGGAHYIIPVRDDALGAGDADDWGGEPVYVDEDEDGSADDDEDADEDGTSGT